MDQVLRGKDLKFTGLDPHFLVEKTVPTGCQRGDLEQEMVAALVSGDAVVFLEQVGDVCVPKEHRTVHRRFGPLVFRVDVRTVRQQQLGNVHESAHGRVVQCCRLVVVNVTGVRPGVEQQPGDLEIAVLSGVVEWGFAGPVVHLVHIRPSGEVRLHGGDIVAPARRRPERQLRRSLRGDDPPEREAK